MVTNLSLVTALKGLLEINVKQILMTAMELSARTMEPAKMGLTLSSVTAQMGLLVNNVKQILMTVVLSSVRIMELVKMK